MEGAPRLILASASPARAQLLVAAGVAADSELSGVDEAAIKARFRNRGDSPLACAIALAEAKAQTVSRRRPGALVLGADQLLACGDAWFDKPDSLADARVQLMALRGRTHVLETAACIVCNGRRVWRSEGRPRLTMRGFSDVFLAGYLAAEGPAVLASVGGYRLEGRGVQLFSRIDGDHFTILGLPLVEMLEFLRQTGALPA